MNKREFLDALGARLSFLGESEAQERLSFYCEMIDDRIEAGLLEEDAVKEIGTVGEIFAQIVEDIPITKIVKEKLRPKRKLSLWAIVLLAVGSPIWASLLIAAVATFFSLYVSLWAVIASAWAVFASAAASAVGLLILAIVNAVSGNLAALALFGISITSAGLAILLFFGCMASVRVTLRMTHKLVLAIKRVLLEKEETQG